TVSQQSTARRIVAHLRPANPAVHRVQLDGSRRVRANASRQHVESPKAGLAQKAHGIFIGLMEAASKHTEIVIVGAGPAGLMMAAQLLRYGLRPTIIDGRTGPDKRSKALVLQGRTLELFRQLG